MASLEDLLLRIRRADSSFWMEAKKVAKCLLDSNLPAPRVLFRPLYELLVVWRFFVQLLLEKVFFVPIFKARCERCGRRLHLSNGIPWIEGNLRLRVGNDVMFDRVTFLSGSTYKDPTLVIGDRSVIGHMCVMSVCKSVTIGSDVLIAGGCFIADNNGHPSDPWRRLKKEPLRENEIKPVVIEDNVWIGMGCRILKGVTIGQGSIVAANSLVNRNVPPYSVVMGVPAKIIYTKMDTAFTKDEEKQRQGA